MTRRDPDNLRVPRLQTTDDFEQMLSILPDTHDLRIGGQYLIQGTVRRAVGGRSGRR